MAADERVAPKSMSERFTLRVLSLEDRALWNQFVAEHPRGHLMQSWEWGELKSDSGWHPLRLALWDLHRQHIVAGAQVLQRTAPHVPLRAGNLAYIPKGPLLDWTQEELCTTFFSALERTLRARGALALHMELPQEEDAAERPSLWYQLQALHAHRVRTVQPLRTIMLDLSPSEEMLLAQMKEKWRYNVRLASRKGVQVRVAETRADVQAWYRLLETTGERDEFGIHTVDYYLRAWELFAPDDTLRLFLAEYDGQLLAGIFVSLFAREAIYLYGASSNEMRNLMPNYLLQWEAIRWAKNNGALRYDFWGIPETDAEDEAMAGVYRFKRGWGGQVVCFSGCYEQEYHPLAMKVARRFL